MGKHSPVNRITLKLIDNLKPDGFELIDEYLLEPENLKFAQMKVTAKLARFNFDQRAFLEYLDINHNDQVELHKLFSVLADKLSLYFSIGEQIAIRNALFPGSRNESVAESRARMVNLKGYIEPKTKMLELAPDQTIVAEKQEKGRNVKLVAKKDKLRDVRGSRPFAEVLITT